jgi:hypothetical protein
MTLVAIVSLFAAGDLRAAQLPGEDQQPPGETSQFPPEQVRSKVLFQELDIKRTPKFAVLGAITAQDLRYQILSELRIGEGDKQELRPVEQTVKDARLLAADELSAETFEQSLKALKGATFRYKVNRVGEVSDFAPAPAKGAKFVPAAPKGAMGFLVTSVMDDDGWNEVAQLSFFVPSALASGKQGWSRPMTHDFGPLGSWSGKTNFTRKGTQSGVLRIDYVHQMKYKPPGKGRGDLPLAITAATFKPEAADGTIRYDTKAGRVQSAEERFFVKGSVATEILGEALTAEIEEQQVISVRILERNPWKQ